MSRGAVFAICGVGIALFILFCSLGVWQIQRLHWKRALIERVETRAHAAPMALDEALAMPETEWEYRRVQVSGRFEPGAEALAKAVTELGSGYWVLAPFRLQDGGVVVINRGFVPQRQVPQGLPSEDVVITGLLRLSEPGGGFLRANDPKADRWYSRDVSAMAARYGWDVIAPVFIDAEAGKSPQAGDPIGGLTVIHFRNTHLSYALTWFVLAAMVAGGLVMALRDVLSRHSDAF